MAHFGDSHAPTDADLLAIIHQLRADRARPEALGHTRCVRSPTARRPKRNSASSNAGAKIYGASQQKYLVMLGVTRYVGGVHTSRSHKGDEKSGQPLVVVPAKKQRKALELVEEQVFSDKPFGFPPELYSYLARRNGTTGASSRSSGPTTRRTT